MKRRRRRDRAAMCPPGARVPRTFRQVIWSSFSEADERFLDIFRVGYALGLLGFLVFSGYSLFFKGDSFDPMAWSGGFAALLFGGGVAVGARGRLEDGPTNRLEELDAENPYVEPSADTRPGDAP